MEIWKIFNYRKGSITLVTPYCMNPGVFCPILNDTSVGYVYLR